MLKNNEDTKLPKVCLISCIEQVQNIRTFRLLKTISNMGYKTIAIMPGYLPNDNIKVLHYRIPTPKANFWYHKGFLNTLLALYYRLKNVLLLILKLIKIKPDIIICREPDSWAVAILTKFIFNCKVICEITEIYEDRSLAFPKFLRPVIYNFIRASMRYLSHLTDEIIHVSYERQNYYNYLKKPGIVIGHYPEISLFPPIQRRTTNSIRLIHAGSLRYTYASNQLIESLLILTESNLDFKLTVLGGIADKQKELSEKIKFLINKGRLEIKEVVPYHLVIQWLYNSDIGISLVLPVDQTHYLAFPQKLFEYFAAGLPVIAADVPSIRCIICKYKCGLLVDPTSPAKIAEAIMYLAENNLLRSEMSKNARLAAELEFNWEGKQAVLGQVIQNLIQKRNKKQTYRNAHTDSFTIFLA